MIRNIHSNNSNMHMNRHGKTFGSRICTKPTAGQKLENQQTINKTDRQFDNSSTFSAKRENRLGGTIRGPSSVRRRPLAGPLGHITTLSAGRISRAAAGFVKWPTITITIGAGQYQSAAGRELDWSSACIARDTGSGDANSPFRVPGFSVMLRNRPPCAIRE